MDDDSDVPFSEQAALPELIAGWHEVGGIDDGDGDNGNVLA